MMAMMILLIRITTMMAIVGVIFDKGLGLMITILVMTMKHHIEKKQR